jgi:hypothetical protein
LVPIYANANSGALSVSAVGQAGPLFYGIPIKESAVKAASTEEESLAERRSSALVYLRQFRRRSGDGFEYSTLPQTPQGCEAEGKPICRVWKVPGQTFVAEWQTMPVSVTLE